MNHPRPVRAAWSILLLGLVSSSACAPLNSLTMSDSCRTAYNTCMNLCPRSYSGFQPEVAQCTAACNRQAGTCR